jgi:hypothetical protein
MQWDEMQLDEIAISSATPAAGGVRVAASAWHEREVEREAERSDVEAGESRAPAAAEAEWASNVAVDAGSPRNSIEASAARGASEADEAADAAEARADELETALAAATAAAAAACSRADAADTDLGDVQATLRDHQVSLSAAHAARARAESEAAAANSRAAESHAARRRAEEQLAAAEARR